MSRRRVLRCCERRQCQRDPCIIDGVIIASSPKHDGVWWNQVDSARVRTFMAGLKR
ncbi:hypothetical protein NKI18_22615 [Mesorhizobium sp. M0800]